jgi:surfeit locus 1 family protein
LNSPKAVDVSEQRRRRSSVVLIATVLGVAATSSLGTWQLNRAAQKLALQAAMESREAQPELPGLELANSAAAAVPQYFQRTRLKGQWMAAKTVYLDNRQMNDKPGFFVVTPLKLSGSDQAVVVQRGWAARNFVDRSALPSVVTPPGEVEVIGLIAPPPSRLFEFAGAAPGPIRQNLDLVAYAAEVGTPLKPLSILQSDDPAAKPAADGLLRQWPRPALGIQKHYGYAFQWFALSALIASLYVWFQLIRPRLRATSISDRPDHD